MVLVGTSEYLFPVPLKELRKVCDEVGATILYDAAHVSGLIVGQTFQDPLTEGADLLSLSTNKTLAAPDHGIVACNNPAYRAKIEHAIVPLFTSNHHAHHVAGLAITLAEFDVFGHDYAVQVIKNAKALARELYQLGITVLCPEQDFTESHTVLFDAKMPGTEAMKLLEDAQIITNSFQLPWNDENKTTGIRMGTNEMTRKGMKEKEIKEIARLIASCLFKRKPAEKIKREVVELVSNFRTVGYCFSINS